MSGVPAIAWEEQLQQSQRRLQQLVAAASRSRGNLPRHLKEFHALLGSIIGVGSKNVEVILFGSGNVGKSSVSNSLLGKKVFWPVSAARMTGRLCKTHYGDSDEYLIDGESRQPMTEGKIPSGLVNNSTDQQDDQEEFHAQLQVALQAWTSSNFLRPGVTLIDVPGLDQKKEYLDVLLEFMKTTQVEQVVLLYVMNVRDGMRNPDRQFLEGLKR